MYYKLLVDRNVFNRMNTDMVKLSSLQQANGGKNKTKGVIHHSDRALQYLSIHYKDKMTDSSIITFIDTTGYPYDNAFADKVKLLTNLR